MHRQIHYTIRGSSQRCVTVWLDTFWSAVWLAQWGADVRLLYIVNAREKPCTTQ